MAAPNTYSIVLLGRYAGKDRAVAQSLARLFGRDDAWGLQVVGASPIVLMHNLLPEQSEAILAAMGEAEMAGCQLEIQPGVDEGLPKLGWPAPPRIRGKLIAEFTTSPIPFAQPMQAGQNVNGPGAQIMQPTAVPNPVQTQGTTVNLVVPCPYTGQKMKLAITLHVTRAEGGGTSMNVSASATQHGAPSVQMTAPAYNVPQPNPSRPPSRPNVLPAAYGGINTPLSNPAVRTPAHPNSPPMQQPQPHSHQTHPQQPHIQQPMQPMRQPAPSAPRAPVPPSVQDGYPVMEDMEQLIPLPDVPAAPPARPPQRRSPASPRPIPTAAQAGPPAPPSSIIPLPDVPVIHGPNGHSPAAPPSSSNMPMVAPMPSDPMSAPMDLDAFEAKVSASGIMRAVSPDAEVFDDQNGNGDDGSICSVFMGKTNNARVHQLVAELHGISVAEATRYCQKPIVALAKEVTSGDAADIRQRFAALNVNVRITKKK